MATALKFILKKNHLQTYGLFRSKYQRAASRLNSDSLPPSRAQFHRWLAGDLKRLPHARHCQVLEAMFPEYSAENLFLDSADAIEILDPGKSKKAAPVGDVSEPNAQLSGLSQAYTSRSDFAAQVSMEELFDAAEVVEVSGLSLNLICQQYSANRLLALINSGASVECLFLDPKGTAIQAREQEEGYENGELQSLTAMNIDILRKQVHSKLDSDSATRLRLATYDQTLRFNLIFVDHSICVFQHYTYAERGVEAPTFVAEKGESPGVYESMYNSYLWLKKRSTNT